VVVETLRKSEALTIALALAERLNVSEPVRPVESRGSHQHLTTDTWRARIRNRGVRSVGMIPSAYEPLSNLTSRIASRAIHDDDRVARQLDFCPTQATQDLQIGSSNEEWSGRHN
jgi:hypothetical protein